MNQRKKSRTKLRTYVSISRTITGDKISSPNAYRKRIKSARKKTKWKILDQLYIVRNQIPLSRVNLGSIGHARSRV